ncbi:DDE-domain-containing protein [Cadophora sp. DSE1049]|nr:DDE-domain-containing protein [Cadophora sp. DSE1049]
MAKSTPQIKRRGSKKGKKRTPLDARIARIRKMPKYKTPVYISQEAKIQAALEAYENPDDTEITSLRIAAGVFNGVSYSTLNHRYKKRDLGGSKTLAENGGHNKKLNEAQEASLICLSMEVFQRIGQCWARRWVERMDAAGRYHALRTTPMDQKRKDCMTIGEITGCFEKLAAVMAKYSIHWKDIFNMDEIGFRVGCISSTTVITHKNIRKVYTCDPVDRESVSVIECISAAGYAIDCYIIMPGAVYLEKMFNNNLPPGTKISCSEKGYSSDELALEWLKHFDQQTRGRQQGQWRLLIFDGYGSHMTYEFISRLPSPNQSQNLQERDNSVSLQAYRHMATERGCHISAFKLTQDTQMGDKDTGGRVYNHTLDNPSNMINVPASNEPVSRWVPANNRFWEAETASDDEYDYIPWIQDDGAFDDEPEDGIQLPQLPRDGNIDITDDLIAPLASSRIDELLDIQDLMEAVTPEQPSQPKGVVDYGDYGFGKTAEDPRWYKKTPFFDTPYGAKGINAHAEFLETYEDILSSPSKRLSNKKFRKGSTVNAILADAARQELTSVPSTTWGSQSLVLNDEDSAKGVKSRGGGRVISSGEGLRIIGERNEAAQESKLTKLRREANIAGNVLKLEEEKIAKALARQQKKKEKEIAKVQKRMEKTRIREEKAQAKIQYKLDRAAKIQALISTGKKPRGRKPNTINGKEATQQEPMVMAASQRPIRTKRPTQKAIEIPSDTEQESSSDIESVVESDLSADSDSDVNLTDNSGGGPVDYDDYN